MIEYAKPVGCIAAAVLALFFLCRRRPKLIPGEEPPYVDPLIPIPYIGHAMGLFWQCSAYYTNISKKWNLPIISLSMFGSKMYIISSPELIQSLHRQPRVLSVWVMEGQLTTLLGGMSADSAKILHANLGATGREPSLLIKGPKGMQHAMSPQGGMEEMLRRAAEVTKSRLDQLTDAEGVRNVDLWAWVQHEITVATTKSVYGVSNPYRDPDVESAFWTFANDNIAILFYSNLPKLFASKGIAAREVVVRAMRPYFQSGAHEGSSPLTTARYASLKDHISCDDMAGFETVNGLAIIVNSLPVAFWTVYHIITDPQLFADIRAQVESITTDNTTEQGKCIRKINLHALKDAPLLFSTIQETLRYRVTGTGPRMVMQDTIIGQDSYRLKRDSVIMIANRALHFEKAAWGPTADQFIAERFCHKTPAHAFRAFGGGVNLRPGKSFVMQQIAAFVVMLVARLDVLPENGKWADVGQDGRNMAVQIAPPDREVRVRIVPRSKAEGCEWVFEG